MGQDKGQKTDRRDSSQLGDALDRYLRGNRTALSPVAVPTAEQEEEARADSLSSSDHGRSESL